ncbi:hypothetical protein HK102_006820, partial [Quaeritorhiza haematococci]
AQVEPSPQTQQAGTKEYEPTFDDDWELPMPVDVYECTRPGVMALTFDDGPFAAGSPILLDILKKHNVKATFFLQGSNIYQNPSLLLRMWYEGHQIATHTFFHPSLTKLNSTEPSLPIRDDSPWEEKEALIKELMAIRLGGGELTEDGKRLGVREETTLTEDLVYQILGVTPRWMRPPYGDIDKRVFEIMSTEMDRITAGWNLNSRDWGGVNPVYAIQKLANVTYPRGIVALFHDYEPKLAIQIEEGIKHAKSLGFEFDTMAGCINGKPGETSTRGEAKPWKDGLVRKSGGSMYVEEREVVEEFVVGRDVYEIRPRGAVG